MKELPILFSGPMVRALLDGRKTQTRRIVKSSRAWPIGFIGGRGDRDDPSCYGFEDFNSGEWWTLKADGSADMNQIPSPYGRVGDRLWVRETWGEFIDTDIIDGQTHELGRDTLYRADGENHQRCTPWRPSIHMPRWASRLTLEVTDVRVERLQDISEEDAIAEGVESIDFEREERDWSICPKCGGTRLHEALGPNGGIMFDVDCRECDTHVKRYRHLWDSLNAARGYGLDANSWVWVVEFKRIES